MMTMAMTKIMMTMTMTMMMMTDVVAMTASISDRLWAIII